MKKYLRVDLLIISSLAIVCAVGLQLGLSVSLPRVILALLLLLLLPGYAFYAALFVKHSFGAAEHILGIVGSSILIAIAAGVILNGTSWGLSTSSWADMLCGLTLIGCLIAGLRRSEADYKSFLPVKINPGWGQGLILFLAVLVTVGAVGLSQTAISNPANLQGYAILWILPVEKDAPKAVNLGIMNDQFSTTDYDLRIIINNKVVYEWPNIKLTPGEKWEETYGIPGKPSSSTPIEATLYRLDNPDAVYRQVKLLLGP